MDEIEKLHRKKRNAILPATNQSNRNKSHSFKRTCTALGKSVISFSLLMMRNWVGRCFAGSVYWHCAIAGFLPNIVFTSMDFHWIHASLNKSCDPVF